MKRKWLLAAAICATAVANAQITDQETAKKSAFAAAKAMDEALIQHRYDDYSSFNHPTLVAQVEGGRRAMALQLAKQLAEISESGNTITAVWPSPPDVVIDTAGEWQATLQQYMTYRLPEGTIKSVTTIIGMSPDQGKQWYFIDAAGRNLDQMRQIFPKLSSKLKIAKPTEPQFTADNPGAPPAPAGK
jgi:hypothetical protein